MREPCLSYAHVEEVFAQQRRSKGNVYVVPMVSFSGFIRDELLFVRSATSSSCTVWRPLDNKVYNLEEKQLKQLTFVGLKN